MNLSIKVTRKEFRNLLFHHYFLRWKTLLIIGVLLWVIIASLYMANTNPIKYSFPYIPIFLIVFYCLSVFLYILYRTEKEFSNNPALGTKIAFSLMPQRIEIGAPDIKLAYNSDELKRVRKRPPGLLIYFKNKDVYFLPKNDLGEHYNAAHAYFKNALK